MHIVTRKITWVFAALALVAVLALMSTGQVRGQALPIPVVTTEIHVGSDHTTDVQGTEITAGTEIHDQVTVTGPAGAPTPTGQVNLEVFSGTDCTTFSGLGIGALTDGVIDFLPVTVGAAGRSYLAHYQGDSEYAAADGPCEFVTGVPLTPVVTTEIHVGTDHTTDAQGTVVTPGTEVHDQVTVTGPAGSPTPTGQVNLESFSDTECTSFSGLGIGGLTDGVLDFFPATVEAAGRSYLAHYQGDSIYTAADGPCEWVAGVLFTPVVTTEIHAGNDHTTDIQGTSIPVNTPVHDQATVTGVAGGPTPTGTVDIERFGTTDCSAGSVTTVGIPLVGGVAENSNVNIGSSGRSFLVHYNGDAFYDEADGPCEWVDALLIPEVTTQIHKGDDHTNDIQGTSVAVDTPVHDQAVVRGVVGQPTPTGTVDIETFGDTGCNSMSLVTPGIPLVGGVAESSNLNIESPGRSYLVHYNGDAFYDEADGPCEWVEAFTPVGGLTVFSDGSGSSAGSKALLVGGIAAVIAIATAGAWYTRRRWLADHA